jgi:phosphoenolpyruvate synthase/pyruvate phosphate dikinase
MADVQIEQEIKMYRIADDAVMELLAKGKPGSPGAMAGRLALTVEQALQFKKRKEGVILLTTEPQDENVYLLTLGHNIDGIMATYGIGRGSHIADFSQANGIPMVASLRGVKLQKNAMVIGGKKIRVGDPILIEGNKGMVYLTEESDPIVEDKTVVSSSYGINFLEQMRSVRTRFAAKTYDEVLAEHAEGTKYLKELLDGKQSREAIVGIQARIHCLHRLAYEKGKLLKKNEIQVDLDVAVADGNLDRIPGLEDKEFYFDKTLDKTGEEYFLIMGTELEYESDMIQDGGIPLKDVHELVEAIRGGDLKAEYYYRSRKITMHRQHLSTFGIRFHKDEYSRVVEFLKDYFLASNGVNKK